MFSDLLHESTYNLKIFPEDFLQDRCYCQVYWEKSSHRFLQAALHTHFFKYTGPSGFT